MMVKKIGSLATDVCAAWGLRGPKPSRQAKGGDASAGQPAALGYRSTLGGGCRTTNSGAL